MGDEKPKNEIKKLIPSAVSSLVELMEDHHELSVRISTLELILDIVDKGRK
jgi:hypothetical protein